MKGASLALRRHFQLIRVKMAKKEEGKHLKFQ
jgi:hypothetical protein